MSAVLTFSVFFFFQAEDGIRDLVRSRGLGDVYKRQHLAHRPSGIDLRKPSERLIFGGSSFCNQLIVPPQGRPREGQPINMERSLSLIHI